MTAPVNLSRRSLLRGRGVTVSRPVRPPGALVEAHFIDTCTTCGDCVTVCPQRIIVRGEGGYPAIDFRRGECTFCNACIEACTDDALRADRLPPWSLKIELAEHCLARRNVVCRSCGDECETEAISFRPELGKVPVPSVNHDLCTGCGACISVCPENALRAVNGE